MERKRKSTYLGIDFPSHGLGLSAGKQGTGWSNDLLDSQGSSKIFDLSLQEVNDGKLRTDSRPAGQTY